MLHLNESKDVVEGAEEERRWKQQLVFWTDLKGRVDQLMVFRIETQKYVLHALVGYDPRRGNDGEREALQVSRIFHLYVEAWIATLIICLKDSKTYVGHPHYLYGNTYGQMSEPALNWELQILEDLLSA